MSNQLAVLNPEYWSKRMQIVRIDEPVFQSIARMEERELTSKGDTVHRPYRSRMGVRNYTKGIDVTIPDVNATDEYLTVDQSKLVPFYFDDIDDKQNGYHTANDFADDAGRELYSYIDGRFLAEVLNAVSTIDDGDVGGTAGTALTLSAANSVKILAVAKKKLKRKNAKMAKLIGVVSPSFIQALTERLEGKNTPLGDETGKNGKVGRYLSFDLYESNNCLYTARWTPADNPSNAATITIDDVVFTFVSSIGTTAGNVLIGDNTAATLDNLVALVLAPETTTSTGVGFNSSVEADAEALNKIYQMSLTDGTTYVGLTYYGGSEAVVATSEALDLWSLQIVHNMFSEDEAIDMVIQTLPKVEFKDHPFRLGKNVFTHSLYGIKSFLEGRRVMIDCKVKANVL